MPCTALSAQGGSTDKPCSQDGCVLEAEASLGDLAASTGAKPRITTIFQGDMFISGDFIVRIMIAAPAGRMQA